MGAIETATKVAWSYHGTFYTWGGDDPSGFDCSGLVIEILKSVGRLPRKGDWTAHALLQHFSQDVVPTPTEGCLVFWIVNGRAIHVEYCLGSWLAIGASGGGSQVKTRASAIQHNAFIKVRPIESRAGQRTFVNPFLEAS